MKKRNMAGGFTRACLMALCICAVSPEQALAAAGNADEQQVNYILGRPLTEEEILAQKAQEMAPIPFDKEQLQEIPSVKTDTAKKERSVLPSSYDSRTYGYVTSVKNQGVWGTCWAHTLAAAAESNMLKKGLADLEEIDLSERHLAYFYNHTPEDPLGNAVGDQAVLNTTENYLTMGGNVISAAFTLANWVGFADESLAPYDANEDMEALDESLAFQDTVHLENAYFVAAADQEEIKKLIMEQGAASIIMLYDDLNDFYNYDTAAYYGDYMGSYAHSVTVVGWDDDYGVQNFNSARRPANNGAWLVKNNWGEEWGDQGYFWISYEDVGVHTYHFQFTDVEKADNYENNYYYDGGGENCEIVVENGSSIANIFTVKAEETGAEAVEAVSFATQSTNVQYEISIYKDLEDLNDPESGTLMDGYPQTGMVAYCGYHTIPLEQPITVMAGSTFSVVIKVRSEGEGTVKCCVDMSGYSGNAFYFQTSEKAGQSFYKGNATNMWIDTALGSVSYTMRIKAFTSKTLPILLQDISMSESEKMLVGETRELQVSYIPENVTDTRLSWSSSHPAVAEVDEEGVVTAIGEGTCTITAQTDNGKTAVCTVTVWKPQKTEGMKVVASTLDSITFQWDKQEGITGYQIYRYDNDRKEWDVIANITGENNTTWTDTGREQNSIYWYAVRAYVQTDNGTVWGESSSYLKGFTASKKTTVPALRVNVKGKKAKLYWGKEDGVDGYEIYMSVKNKKNFKRIKVIKKGTRTTFTKKMKKKKCFFKIRAYSIENGQKVYSGYSKVRKAVRKK